MFLNCFFFFFIIVSINCLLYIISLLSLFFLLWCECLTCLAVWSSSPPIVLLFWLSLVKWRRFAAVFVFLLMLVRWEEHRFSQSVRSNANWKKFNTFYLLIAKLTFKENVIQTDVTNLATMAKQITLQRQTFISILLDVKHPYYEDSFPSS